MGKSTLTLTASGRLPGALGSPTKSTVALIASGVVGYMPHAASGFSCLLLSCLGAKGAGNGPGMIGIPQGSGEQSGTISIYQIGSASPATVPMQLRLGAVSVQRITGTTTLPAGGGTQLPNSTTAQL